MDLLHFSISINSLHSHRKRLKMPMALVVHVEHDPVAVSVCRFNHANDKINHHYIESFEEIYGTDAEVNDELFAAFVQRFGPFDLVLSAAPCQNYSGLNARRDQSSNNAQYLLKVGRLIHKLDEVQMSSMGVKDKVVFLSENVVFKEHDEVDKSYAEGKGEALTPICVDAQDFGPCKRKRFYWMNVSTLLVMMF
jgi:site-specific DNA-cytosine methylase